MKKVKISEIKPNPENPRIIKDDKFEKLTKSIKDFPKMLELRPIVVNSDMVVLGGNMRLRACQQAGLKEVPIVIANDLTEKEQREFIIKDNIGYGEWDWDILANEWDLPELEDWGLDVIKHNWEQLDYIDEDIKAPNPAKNVITIVVPESSDIKEVEADIKAYLQEKHIGCEVK